MCNIYIDLCMYMFKYIYVYIYIIYIYIYKYIYIYIYVWYFKHNVDFKCPPFFIWFMKYSVVAESSDIKNNKWKVPADKVKQETLIELLNIK